MLVMPSLVVIDDRLAQRLATNASFANNLGMSRMESELDNEKDKEREDAGTERTASMVCVRDGGIFWKFVSRWRRGPVMIGHVATTSAAGSVECGAIGFKSITRIIDAQRERGGRVRGRLLVRALKYGASNRVMKHRQNRQRVCVCDWASVSSGLSVLQKIFGIVILPPSTWDPIAQLLHPNGAVHFPPIARTEDSGTARTATVDCPGPEA
ncbi:hypothetical protein B0H66DRAFT_535221 [Apodospora peruviana]|uniref:Uncharacterized protein n=1 Tax=Apodospora peruviana TaxID=516989 RepID=A0AAE0M3X1_9PEZI|nr:hypothetical protein B0H66DRAFT_535221 [Apodospora peruviana]